MLNFIKKRIKSIRYASKGAYLLIFTEASIKVQFFIATAVTVLGLMVGLSKTEWILQILTIAIVLSVEGLNTAIEKLADFVHPGYHEKIGFVKDVAAGAVFITALAAVSVGLIIYLPKFF